MRRELLIGFFLATALPVCAGFVPYEHEGLAILPFQEGMVTGRALFNSENSAHPQGVVVYVDIELPWGGEGYLTMDVSLGGGQAATKWTYYEKTGVNTFAFEAQSTKGRVDVLDRYEAGSETSLRLAVSATFVDGSQTRTIANGSIVTAPSPEVLRTHGLYPDGIVVVDDGSGAYVASGVGYERGDLNCYGVYEDPNDDPYYDPVYPDDDPYDDPYDGETDSNTDDYEYDSDYDYGDEDDFDCSGDDETGDSGERDDEDLDCSSDSSSDSSTSESDDSSGPDCSDDAEAAPARAGICKVATPQPGVAVKATARRLVKMSPMLGLLLALFFIGAWRSPRRRKNSAPSK